VNIIVDEKFKHMKIGGAGAAEAPKGNADDAFGSDDDDDW